jgi:hypothetical protein
MLTISAKLVGVWIADAHRGDGKRFVVRADEKLTAFIELESAIREAGKMRYRENRCGPKLPNANRSQLPRHHS